jgi:NAD(P)-dependent dehydrogenase (short-subunit alcohol dehydrogenase family)
MSGSRLEGRRVLILGASAGIGKATGLAVAAEGARVAMAARRPDLVNQVVAEAGLGCFGFECDVRDPVACERVVRESVDALGGLDAVVYAPGLTLFGEIEEMGGAEWQETFETNVFGASLITRAALPHLLSTRGKVIYFSSFSINDRPPRAGMSVYVASKTALESMAQAWQGEHPNIGFTTITIGDTLTEKSEVTPPDVVAKWVPRWEAAGLGSGRLMAPDSVAEQVVNILSSRETVRQLAITPIPSD